MFLATTADQTFWKTDKKILFLGEWCRRYDQKHVWSKLDHEVLPYPWDDRARMYQAYHYLRPLCDRIIETLGYHLNGRHGVDHSTRYWEILIGPWLTYMVDILYDRYLCIQSAADLNRVTHTWISDPPPERWVLGDFSGLYPFLKDDFNQYLYGRIIALLAPFSFEIKPEETRLDFPRPDEAPSLIHWTVNHKTSAERSSGPEQWLKRLLGIYARSLPSRLNRVLFVSTGLSIIDRMKLQVSLAQLPCPVMVRAMTKNYPVDWNARNRLHFLKGENTFESLLERLIPLLIPRAYIEGYVDLRQKVLADLPEHPRVIVTANARVTDEGFRFWAAHHVDRGAKLVVCQHGGIYGTGLWHTGERHEVRVSDRYFSWGWKELGEPRVVPLPSAKLTVSAKLIKYRPDGDILLVCMSSPHYFYRMFSVIVGPQLLAYHKDQEQFHDSLTLGTRRLLCLRLHPHHHGWDVPGRWKDKNPSLRIASDEHSMYHYLNQSRLCVVTYNSTAYLETFVADYPTLLFWNPEHFELRETARPYFDALRQVGIFHESPESAAKKVNEIVRDPLSWWRSVEVQTAKNKFCRQYARTSQGWLKQWSRELRKVVNASR